MSRLDKWFMFALKTQRYAWSTSIPFLSSPLGPSSSAHVRKQTFICEPVLLTYVATNSIRHLDWTLFVKIRHEDTRFSIPNFGGSVLGCVDADCCDQVLVGKRLTRSTTSTFFSFAKLSQNFEITVLLKFSARIYPKTLSKIRQFLTNAFVNSSFWVTNC